MTAQVSDMMARQIAQLVRLIDDLLDVARINSGKVVLKKTDVELGRVINAALETALPAIESAEHELIVQLRDDATVLHADPARLAQVIGNLLSNARRNTRRREVASSCPRMRKVNRSSLPSPITEWVSRRSIWAASSGSFIRRVATESELKVDWASGYLS